MRSAVWRWCWVGAALVAGSMSPARAQALTPEKARGLGADLYDFAFPIVLMDITMRQTTNVPDATAISGRAPINAFAHFRAYPKADARDIVRFNFDTLYSFAWVDLNDGPMILTVPDTGGRFYLVPTLDMWTDVFSTLGPRTTGTKAGNYGFVAPGWKSELPAGVQRIDAPTSTIWVMGRVQTNGPKDYDNVHKVQDGLKLTPLSLWGKGPIPPGPSVVDGSVDAKTPPLNQILALDGIEILTRLARLMQRYPAHPNDYPLLFRARALGIEPGREFDPSKLDPATVAAINAGAKEAQADLVASVKTVGKRVNGWSLITENVGTYGTSYRQRAVVALAGLGANLPEDAIYPTAFVDGAGKTLDGSHDYRVHFPKGKLPPADAFWSITLYDDQGFQVPNAIDRFAIGDRDALTTNPDGSLDLVIQAKSPGKAKESNWLPSPAKGSYALTMRIYAPRSSVVQGTWTPPGVQRTR